MPPTRHEYLWTYPAEDIGHYKLGGYHPVHYHDYFNDNRYEILNKIGDGYYGTVWAARDHQNECNVCIKIIRADTSKDNIELQVLQRIEADKNTEHRGRQYLPSLLDHFYHDGINGRHLCLVMEMLGPSLSDLHERREDYRISCARARRVTRQLLLAIEYLHSIGFAHGDIHENNILHCFPATHQSAFKLGKVHKAMITRKDGGPLEKGIPEYFAIPPQYDKGLFHHLIDIKLIDFSGSFFITNPPKKLWTPFQLQSPELILCRPLSEAVDIWSIACLSSLGVTRREQFEVALDSREAIPAIHGILGQSTAHYLLTGMTEALENGAWTGFPKFWFGSMYGSLEEEISTDFFKSYPNVDDRTALEQDLKVLARFLRKAFVVDPLKRPTATDLLDDEWVRGEVDGGIHPHDPTHEMPLLESVARLVKEETSSGGEFKQDDQGQ